MISFQIWFYCYYYFQQKGFLQDSWRLSAKFDRSLTALEGFFFLFFSVFSVWPAVGVAMFTSLQVHQSGVSAAFELWFDCIVFLLFKVIGKKSEEKSVIFGGVSARFSRLRHPVLPHFYHRVFFGSNQYLTDFQLADKWKEIIAVILMHFFWFF